MIWFFIIYFFQKYVLFLLSKNAALVFLRKKNIAEVATDKIIIRLHWGFVRSVDVIFLRKHTVCSQNFRWLSFSVISVGDFRSNITCSRFFREIAMFSLKKNWFFFSTFFPTFFSKNLNCFLWRQSAWKGCP